MQKELYQIERSEVSLNISEGEVRRKHIVRSGCRVYDGGKLGISGVFGEPDEATWQAAQRALTAGLSHPEPLGALVRSRETGVMPEERELLEQSEALLAHLREECPGFVFSNKIVALSERVRLENDLGRRLDDRQSGSFLNLVVKDEASPNVFDTGIGWTSRGNAAIDGLEAGFSGHENTLVILPQRGSYAEGKAPRAVCGQLPERKARGPARRAEAGERCVAVQWQNGGEALLWRADAAGRPAS